MKGVDYFVTARSSIGLVNHIETNILGIEKLILLEGDYYKREILEHIKEHIEQIDIEYDLIHSAEYPDRLAAIILRGNKLGIIDSEILANANLEKLDQEIIIYNINSVIYSNIINKSEHELVYLFGEIESKYSEIYNIYREALDIHHILESLYVRNMDFVKANMIAEDLIKEIITTDKYDKTPTNNHRFFGAINIVGSTDYIDNLTANISKRYLIKGRPGTGKSTLLKKIVTEANNRGIDVELYHCSFDPNSLDMIILRELSVAVFDSTKPHEHFPSGERDKIVDIYEEAVTKGTDERYATYISNNSQNYNSKVNEAREMLKYIKQVQKYIDGIYREALLDGEFASIRDEIITEVKNVIIQ